MGNYCESCCVSKRTDKDKFEVDKQIMNIYPIEQSKEYILM